MQWCPVCGWPAGRLVAEVRGHVLALARTSDSVAPLLMRNVGAGPVEYRVNLAPDQPWAWLLTASGQRVTQTGERRLGPGEADNSLRVAARGPDVPAEIGTLIIEVISADRGGRNATDRRPWSAQSHRWRRWQLHVPLRRMGAPDIRLGRSLVIFTTGQREVRVRVANVGGSAADLSLQGLPSNIRASWQAPCAVPANDDDIEVELLDETPTVQNALKPQTLAPGATMDLVFRAADEFAGQAALTLASSDGTRRELLLYAEPPEGSATLVKHWTVGIDFGTAKSAVYLTDNWKDVEQREPKPLLWPTGPTVSERTATTTRSAVMYQARSDVPLCGHRVLVSAGAEGPNERVIEGMKTLLRGEVASQPLELPGGASVMPVEVVADFMRYLLEEIRAAPDLAGKPALDARFVLTVPVMEDRQAFLMQRENTLQAAIQAGLPASDTVTPSEPECAALDLMHSLRRGDYVFDGKVYHLQDKEILLVFDCGAGTTDIAVLRVLLSDGRFGVEQLAAAGYRFGGNVVDDLLLSRLLDQRVVDLRFERRRGADLIRLPGLPKPLPVHAARAECRRLKESLFAPGAPGQRREFPTDLGTFNLAPRDVERLIEPFLKAMFTEGVMPDPARFFEGLNALLDDALREALWREMFLTAGERVRPLHQVLRDAQIERSAVTFLFVTGGTGQIPIIARRLYDFLGRCARTVVATAEDCTINVARGAALYYDYRVTGILRCAVFVVGRTPDRTQELFRRQACAPGALPGPQLEQAVSIGPREALEIALMGEYPEGGPSGDLAARIVRNPSAQERLLIVTTEFTGDRALCWRAAFADGEEAIPSEVVLRI